MISHEEQRKIWDKEHQNPTVLLQMDSQDPSSGVVKFYDWLAEQGPTDNLNGIEMCCGKGRSVIWLASKGLPMTGVDFSPSAITEAKKRAKDLGFAKKTNFVVHDVTKPFPFPEMSFDFAIDCFGSTDIETPEARKQGLHNLKKLIKSGGHLLTYLLSTDDEFHEEMIRKNPGSEPGSFIHPVNGKFEKAFTEQEVKEIHSDMDLVTMERLPKKATFFGKEYNCTHIWAIWQK